MKLYYSPTSPYVRKVCVCALEAGIDTRIERAETNPWVEDQELLADNPLSKVPTLLTDEGLALYDSPVICEYLDSLHEGPRLLPPSGLPRWLALRLQALADGMMDAAIACFLERRRPESQRSADWDIRQMTVLRRALSALERESPAWEDSFGIGQIAAACALGYLDLRFADADWRGGCPRLSAWYGRIATRPSMVATAPPA